MLNRLIITLFILITARAVCSGQETTHYPGFQMIIMDNPSFSGGEGDGVLRMVYNNQYPGNNYNLHSVYVSYDSYFPVLHGGAGIFMSDDYMGGIVSDLRGGLSYAYFLQAGKDLFINAGLSASVFHRGFNFEGAVLPDQIDPLGGTSLPSAENLSSSGRTVFDVGAGFLVISGKMFGGLSVSHLAEPDLSLGGIPGEKLKRKLLCHIAGDIVLNESGNVKLRNIGYFGIQGGFITAGAGTIFEANKVSVNAVILGNENREMDLQSGIALNTGIMSIYYNYRFNILPGNSMMPFSLLHQAGLSFSLKNVDKRKLFKTINFPKL